MDSTVITSIATNHVVNNLDPTMREEAKMFQLSGNVKLENLLEFIALKMSSVSFENFEKAEVSSMTMGEKKRLGKLESMMEKC